jgi:potassium efflux system protein
MPCIGKRTLLLFLGVLLLLAPVAGRAEEPKTPAANMPPPSQEPVAIPVEDIATRAAEVSTFLRTVYAQVAPGHELEKIQRELPELSDRMALEFGRTMRALRAQPTLDILQTEERVWRKGHAELNDWLNRLTRMIDQLNATLTQLTDLQKIWIKTLSAARDAQTPNAIVQQITTVVPAIEAALVTLQTQRSGLLGLQGRIANEAAQAETVLAEIAQAQKRAVAGLASRERRPIWSTDQWIRERAQRPGRWREMAADPWADIDQYLRDPTCGMPFHLSLLIVLLILFLTMRRKVNRWEAGDVSTVISTVSARPFAAAFIVTLLIASLPNSPAPPTVRHLFEALALAPMIQLIKPAVDQRVMGALYALGLLFFFDTVRHTFASATLFDQAMVVLEALGGLAVLGWLLAFGYLQRPLVQASGSSRLRALRTVAILVMVILVAGLLAAVLGYMRIARLLVSGVLIGGGLALALSASIRILSAVAAFLLRVRPLRHLRMVRRHRDLLERRIHRVLFWLAIGGWTIRLLDYIGLFQPALAFVKTLLGAKVERGSISISLEDVLAFCLVLWASHLLSKFIRFVLQEDVYSRRRVPPGKAFAASRLLHYIILAGGFIMGLGVLGVNLTRVTVLLGALGVGIGFGLQNVVNNFVSGLILLFEQPVHVGDFLEMGDLYGQVQRIGLRASIVRTRMGAEIIVPNSQLVSEQVTNWTLSDQLRRINLAVGVNYGAAPQKVVEVIEAAAGGHPRVLKIPPPRALLVGFGDSSIDFDLRFWTDQFADWSKIRSEVAVAVHDAVQAAGMSFPFPQREIRLHTAEEEYKKPEAALQEPAGRSI